MNALIHSKNDFGEIEILEKRNNDYIVKIVETGIICTAIWNPFTGLYYADDKYGKINY